jgi:hypothetical protein
MVSASKQVSSGTTGRQRYMESGEVTNEVYIQEIANLCCWPRASRLDGIRHHPAEDPIQQA